MTTGYDRDIHAAMVTIGKEVPKIAAALALPFLREARHGAAVEAHNAVMDLNVDPAHRAALKQRADRLRERERAAEAALGIPAKVEKQPDQGATS